MWSKTRRSNKQSGPTLERGHFKLHAFDMPVPAYNRDRLAVADTTLRVHTEF